MSDDTYLSKSYYISLLSPDHIKWLLLYRSYLLLKANENLARIYLFEEMCLSLHFFYLIFFTFGSFLHQMLQNPGCTVNKKSRLLYIQAYWNMKSCSWKRRLSIVNCIIFCRTSSACNFVNPEQESSYRRQAIDFM